MSGTRSAKTAPAPTPQPDPHFWDIAAHVLDALPFYVMLVDERHHIELANKAVAETFGVEPAALVGKYCPKAIHGLDHPFPGCPVEQAVAQGKPIEVELRDQESGRRLRSCAYPTSLISPFGHKVYLHTIQDVTELRNAQDELARELTERTALFRLLQFSLRDAPLDEYLRQSLRLLTGLPWLKVEAGAAVFLVGDEPDVLVLHAQLGLPEALLRDCARVRFGHCLCGRAAATGEVVTSDRLDSRHETRYQGIHDHGHCCVPLHSSGSGLLGVLNLYLPAGQPLAAAQVRFLQAAADVITTTVDRKRAEARVRDYQHNLEALVAQRTHQLAESARQNQALLELAVMHDFGTPMTVLQVGLDALRSDSSGPLTPAQRQTLAAMARSYDSLTGVRSRMLEVLGLAAGSIRLERASVQLRDVVKPRLRL